ncbi:glycosyltransferase [Deminuibacter soli]|uniref:Glycosyltransferase n=1 Tax=Deminuibacter soli TaxID=2291815 RepID=A0A3E1NCP1_9BACT|nr:glycosyltransferase [Deminuibacter soli]RFM25611.1 glycosyltransferase [Deminuibacter soli]
MSNIVIISPAHPLRGGIAASGERLARQLQQDGHQVTIFTFSLQYPGFMFPGTTQYSSEPAPAGLNIRVCINSINPFNWISTGLQLKRLRPDVIIVRYWLPLMGPCLGTILRIARSNRHTKVVCLADNVKPHEKRAGDKPFTRYFMQPVDAFVTMSDKVLRDLREFTQKKAALVNHPIYDQFGELLPKTQAREHLQLDANDKIILFFGFIRQYKGLDLLLRAMATDAVRNAGIKLLVAGEFYDDANTYHQLISELNIGDRVLLHTDFIPDSEVKYYLCATDFVAQPYRNATQSGVTPLAYHFEKPMLVTNVGGLPDTVPDGKVGVVTAPEPLAIANGILRLYQLGEQHFLPYLKEEKKKYSWKTLADTLLALVQ